MRASKCVTQMTGNRGRVEHPTFDGDLFAAADGLSGQIIMKESGYVEVTTEDQTDQVAVDINATGSFTGNNVPLEVSRSFAMVMGILARTFFGA
ncbi:hypothetical protein [Aestuariivirga litoralis]|uniref:hypothetical protein n=1 Tax=Aestuariivirga litoralis TaxID=2650924 RepID=UPI0018C5D816|nr:hypothetical protein [Aestuariivirga litoralis]MBG1232053.1 hypothetical protein [Aestuariivirga litoralis]